jgi:hypothetical protein
VVSFYGFYGVGFSNFPGWYDEDSEDSKSNLDSYENKSPAEIKTNYVAIGAWYLAEVDLTDKQEEIIEKYRNQKPEAMVGNSIFVFRRVP